MMMQYEYVTVKIKKAGLWSYRYTQHRELIDEYAKKGYRYVGFVPTNLVGYGQMAEMDLVFEMRE